MSRPCRLHLSCWTDKNENASIEERKEYIIAESAGDDDQDDDGYNADAEKGNM